MTQLIKRPATPTLSADAIRTYAGMYVLKMMDLKPEDGGKIFTAPLPSDQTPLEEVLAELAVEGLIELHRRKDRWELTKAGLAYLASLIDEAEALIEEFDDDELPDVVAELERRNLDPFRARFLWGWFDGEFDDLVEFQRRRGVEPVQTLWAYYLTDDEFYAELARELAA